MDSNNCHLTMGMSLCFFFFFVLYRLLLFGMARSLVHLSLELGFYSSLALVIWILVAPREPTPLSSLSSPPTSACDPPNEERKPNLNHNRFKSLDRLQQFRELQGEKRRGEFLDWKEAMRGYEKIAEEKKMLNLKGERKETIVRKKMKARDVEKENGRNVTPVGWQKKLKEVRLNLRDQKTKEGQEQMDRRKASHSSWRR